MFDHVPGHHGPDKLTHKINQHSFFLSVFSFSFPLHLFLFNTDSVVWQDV